MDIGAGIGKWGIGIWMWNVFAREDGDVAICSMYIFLYMADPIEWGKVSLVFWRGMSGRILTYPVLLLSPPLFLLLGLLAFRHSLPPCALESNIFISATVDVCATLLFRAVPVVDA
jgi:hypothetical protein